MFYNMSLAALMVFSASCLTTEYLIIEKSKQQPPNWLTEKEFDRQDLLDKEIGLQLTFAKHQVKDLTLGVNQAQQQAKSYCLRSLFENHFSSHNGTEEGVVLARSQQSFIKEGMVFFDGFLKDTDIIKDIYFERVQKLEQSQKESHYSIFVLCQIEKKHLVNAYKGLKKRLIKSTSPDLRQIGSRIDESVL